MSELWHRGFAHENNTKCRVGWALDGVLSKQEQRHTSQHVRRTIQLAATHALGLITSQSRSWREKRLFTGDVAVFRMTLASHRVTRRSAVSCVRFTERIALSVAEIQDPAWWASPLLEWLLSARVFLVASSMRVNNRFWFGEAIGRHVKRAEVGCMFSVTEHESQLGRRQESFIPQRLFTSFR